MTGKPIYIVFSCYTVANTWVAYITAMNSYVSESVISEVKRKKVVLCQSNEG